MAYLDNPISVRKPVDQSIFMDKSMSLTYPCTTTKSKHVNHTNKNRKTSNFHQNASTISCCDGYQNALTDIVRLIVVVSACGFLLYPYMKLMLNSFIDVGTEVVCVVKEEFALAPMVYISLGFGVFCSVLACWGILMWTDGRCGDPNCKGLKKAAEFDIQLETEDCVKNSSSLPKESVKKGLFKLPRDHHRELEAELKKLAPYNGRAVLVFRARCGCSVGRMEIPGAKTPRKIKRGKI